MACSARPAASAHALFLSEMCLSVGLLGADCAGSVFLAAAAASIDAAPTAGAANVGVAGDSGAWPIPKPVALSTSPTPAVPAAASVSVLLAEPFSGAAGLVTCGAEALEPAGERVTFCALISAGCTAWEGACVCDTCTRKHGLVLPRIVHVCAPFVKAVIAARSEVALLHRQIDGHISGTKCTRLRQAKTGTHRRWECCSCVLSRRRCTAHACRKLQRRQRV